MNTVIYARYSAGPRQTDQSIDGQLRVCAEFCKQRGLTVVDTYCDRHISGRTDERPEFQRLIADAKAHKFEAVVVYKTDRFARNKYDSAIYKRELRRNGIQIFYAAEAIPEGPEGIILESLMEGLAEYYSAELAQKIKRGLNESALKCQSLGSGRPLGYTVDEQKHFQIDPESSQAVKTIFEMYIKGESNAAICDYLNARGLRTSQGNLFNKNSINRIIKNRKYIGEYRYNDIVVEGGMPAIISKETFCLAQAEMERRRTHRAPVSPKAEYLLAGKLFCGHCKGPMQGVSGTGKSGNKWYYYYCANTRGKERTCDKKQVSRDRLEKAVVDFTVRYILQEDVLEELSKKVYAAQERQNNTASEIAFYEKKLAENKKAIANILRAIESGAMTQALPARLQELENEQTVIQGELSYLKGARLAFTEDQILFALLQHLDPRPGESEQDYHRRIITDFVSEVYLYDDRMLIYFNISSADGKLKHADLSAIESGVFDAGLTSSTTKTKYIGNDMYPLYWTPSRGGIIMRYTYEYKRKCVELYREGKWPETPEGVSNKSFRDKVRLWVRAEDSRGPEALKHKNFNRNWTPEERLELVSQVMSGKSCVSVAIEAGIQDRLLYQWVQNYKTKGYNGLVEMKKGRPSKGVPQMKKEEARPLNESEREELIRLRAENEYIKAENEVIKKEIALREERHAAQLKARKQRSSKSCVKKDTN